MLVRIISAIVGLIIIISLLFVSGTIIFNVAVAAMCVIILAELYHACDCNKEHKVHTIIGYIFAVVMPFLFYFDDLRYRYLLGIVCAFAMFFAYIIKHKEIDVMKLSFIVASSFLVTMSLCCLLSLRKSDDVHGVCYVVLALAGAWLGDSGAYFAGTLFGKHKLCPEISPKKTIEGAVGGVVTTGIVFLIYGYIYTKYQISHGHQFETNYVLLIAIGMFSSAVGIIGDLTASLIKREHGVKDYGHIMPGHGGLMDRFDSVLFVVPFVSLVLSYIRIFN